MTNKTLIAEIETHLKPEVFQEMMAGIAWIKLHHREVEEALYKCQGKMASILRAMLTTMRMSFSGADLGVDDVSER